MITDSTRRSWCWYSSVYMGSTVVICFLRCQPPSWGNPFQPLASAVSFFPSWPTLHDHSCGKEQRLTSRSWALPFGSAPFLLQQYHKANAKSLLLHHFSSQATSHSVTNQSSECWRSQNCDAIKTTSSAKSSDEVLSPPNCNLNSTRLHLKILSTKVINRIADKAKAWQRPTPTGTESELLLRTRTQLLLWEYRGWVVTPSPHTPTASPTVSPEELGHKPSPDPQSTCRLVEQIPRPLPRTFRECKAGWLFHNQDKILDWNEFCQSLALFHFLPLALFLYQTRTWV